MRKIERTQTKREFDAGNPWVKSIMFSAIITPKWMPEGDVDDLADIILGFERDGESPEDVTKALRIFEDEYTVKIDIDRDANDHDVWTVTVFCEDFRYETFLVGRVREARRLMSKILEFDERFTPGVWVYMTGVRR